MAQLKLWTGTVGPYIYDPAETLDYAGTELNQSAFTFQDALGNLIQIDVVLGTVAVDLGSKEDVSNKVTSISGASTNLQYPSAKLLYDLLDGLTASQVAFDPGTSSLTSTDIQAAVEELLARIEALEP